MTMADIADSLVIARSTIYDYYSSREEILIEVLQEQFKSVVALVREATAVGEPVEKLRRFVLTYYESIASSGLETLLARSQSAVHRAPERLNALRQEFLQLLVRIIADGTSQGFFRPVSAVQAALAFQGMIANTTYATVLAGKPVKPEALADALVDIFAHGVEKRDVSAMHDSS